MNAYPGTVEAHRAASCDDVDTAVGAWRSYLDHIALCFEYCGDKACEAVSVEMGADVLAYSVVGPLLPR